MIKNSSTRVKIAYFFLALLTLETIIPVTAKALTSGPSQPETRQFAAASTSDMVDLFTGDFKYNIPLLDVDGYPVNLSYASGVGMDDEASWVGLGWNLNVGAVNRSLRGLPDDASGDEVLSENYVKPKITVGGMVTGRVEIAGFSNDFAKMGFNGSLSLSIFSDNYFGYGADVGVSTGVTLGMSYSGKQTSGLNLGAGISMNSSTQDGVSVSPNLSLSVKKEIDDMSSASAGISANIGYNTREGLKSITMGASFNTTTAYKPDDWRAGEPLASATGGYSTSYSKTSFNTPAFYPKSPNVFITQSNSYSFDIGGSVFFGYLAGGVNGYKTVREIAKPVDRHKAYGFMYGQEGKQDPAALMDFMREKDNPVVPNLPNLAIPIATPDLFSYSGQFGSGQFRLYRGGSATFADPFSVDVTNVGALSGEYGFGTYFHGGFSYNKQQINNRTGKWRNNNDFIAKGDYPTPSRVDEEHAYFRIVGEQTRPDDLTDGEVNGLRYFDKIQGTELVRIGLDGKRLTNKIVKGNNPTSGVNESHEYKKTGRQIRRTPIMSLTVEERSKKNPSHAIRKFPFQNMSNFSSDICNWPAAKQSTELAGNETIYRKPKHISEVTVQSEDGMQMIYGLPVYNTKQQEITFSVDIAGQNAQSTSEKSKNLVPYQKSGGKPNHKHLKTDHYYRSETQPAYATAYLLTGVVSPEYQDLTGDGISDDDPGSAYKFNYSKVDGRYGWRSPLVDSADGGTKTKAQHNKGQLADPTDDKGNIVYGEKELWFLHSIESKTKIAYFITEDRNDALGVTNVDGTHLNYAVRQKLLKEIRIYSKTDPSTPIKTVVFTYDYSLCKNTPNSRGTDRGKLTLKSVHFKYNGSTRGEHHPYQFGYSNNPSYAWMSTDRWGIYKPTSVNTNAGFPDMGNDEFPYSTRTTAADSTAANRYAGSWSLDTIKLPTGGEILVDYESDDYGYVQNRRAMQMTRIEAMVKSNGVEAPISVDNLHDAEGFKVVLPKLPVEARFTDPQLRKEWFLRNYLNGQPFLYAKLSVNVSDHTTSNDEKYFDYIPCYAEIERVDYLTPNDTENVMAVLYFKKDKIGGIWNNPFTFAAWQKMRLEYPMYAYPGYKNRIDDERPVAAAVSALTNAIGNFSELRMNFNKRAAKKGFAQKVKLNKSFTRLGMYQQDKNGGGSRVKEIRMSDKWNEMATGGQAAVYGQRYNYSITEEGVTTSSGVATFEPAVGADENPMRMPVPYNQEFKWALSNVFYLEEPMGESLFPSPQVGYRKVTVQPIAADGQPSDKSGYSVSEFYTAKEFPVQVEQTVPEKVESETKRWFPFFGGDYSHELYMSQGYLVKTNDMHGKPFRETNLSRGGDVVSSTEYKYNARSAGSHQVLTDNIPTWAEHGKTDVIRQSVELYTDLREAETANDNRTYNLGVDVIPTFLSFPTPFPHIPVSKNNDYRLFRSATTLKTVEEYGVVLETVKTINGSSIRNITELFDGKTGQPLVTKTQNEFGDWLYTVSIPAFYVHNGMGMAYKTQGMFIRDLKTDIAKGVILSPYRDFLKPGDELLSLKDGNRLWVVNSPDVNNNMALRLIDKQGRVVDSFTGDVKIVRSGFRNLLSDMSTSVVTTDMANISSMFSAASKHNVLDAKGTLYAEAWGRPTDCARKVCPEGYILGPGDSCIRPSQFVQRNYEVKYDPSTYGNDIGYWGALLVPHDGGPHIQELRGFWNNVDIGKFKWTGIWLNDLPTYQWWGFEFSITIPEIPPGHAVYAGMAMDDVGRFYVDGKPFYQALDANSVEYNFAKWHIEPVKLNGELLKAGRYTFRGDVMNLQGNRGIAMELYIAQPSDFQDATEAHIINKRIFNTRELATLPNVNFFLTNYSGEKYNEVYTCPSGGSLSLTSAEPNCGVKFPGDCKDGYIRSPDEEYCTPIKTLDNSPGLNLVEAPDNTNFDSEGTRFTEGGVSNVIKNAYWGGWIPTDPTRGRLNKIGVRLNTDVTVNPKWVGFTYCFQFPHGNPSREKFYIGYGGYQHMRIYRNGELLVSSETNPLKQSQYNVVPIPWSPLYEDVYRVEVKAPANQQPVVAFELLTANNIGDVMNYIGSGTDVITLFTTKDIITQNRPYNSYIRTESGDYLRAKSLCGNQVVDNCQNDCEAIRKEEVLNPYLTGYLGNWVPWMTFAYMDNRNQNNVFNDPYGLNVRKSGTYNIASPFLMVNNGNWQPGPQPINQAQKLPAVYPGWVLANEVTMVNDRREPLENVDALGRYSSARFGFRNTLPVAVASNARHTEIYYDGFEDYYYWKNCLANAACEIGQFNIRNLLGENSISRLEPAESHTGNYSLKLNSGIELETWVLKPENKHTPGIYLKNTAKGEFYRTMAPWLGLWGFAPQHKSKYVFSAWAKVAGSNTPGNHITAKLDNETIVLERKATVDGWSLMEGVFVTPEYQSTDPAGELKRMVVKINGGANVLLDDIRIFPYDAHIKTYSYDDRTLRLSGELDENNFATFYEYDDEGSLIRLKKETDKGIITIKESRTANKKKP